MKWLAGVVFVFMQTCFAFAGVRNPTEAEKSSTNIEARQIAQEIQDAFDQVTCDSPSDDVIKRACALPNKTSKALILWRISEQFISKYYDDKMQQMQNQSSQTNRSVSQDTDNNENEVNETFWLDRGDMDNQKCQWDFDRRNACDYPKGFEEFSISYHDSNSDLSDEETWIILSVWFDNPTENKVNNIHIAFHAMDSADDTEKVMSSSVTVSGTEYKYNDYYKYQNQMARDIRDGMYTKVKRNKSKKNKKSPFAPVKWEMDLSREWDSQRIPPHAAYTRIISSTESSIHEN